MTAAHTQPHKAGNQSAHRPAARLLVAAAILLTPALLPPPPAEAQTVTTLVSNAGKADSAGRSPRGETMYAQSFTTGSHAAGYNLAGIVVHVLSLNNFNTDVPVQATLREDSSSNPGATFATLTSPSSFAVGLNTFTPPENTTLATNTTYHVVIRHEASSSGTDGLRWTRVNLNAGLDSGAAAGWSISNYYRVRINDSGSWTDEGTSRALKIQVRGSAIAQPNTDAVGAPTVSGAAKVDEELTAAPGVITDAEGGVPTTAAGFTYRWERETATDTWTPIAGEDSITYTLVKEDEGMRVRVVVSFTDGGGTLEELPSDPTVAVVRRDNRAATGMPVILGPLVVGQELTARTTDIMDGNELGTFEYQWRRADNAGGGGAATASVSNSATYTLQPGDMGKHMQVVVSFNDGDRYPESRSSAWTTAAVAASGATLSVVTVRADRRTIERGGENRPAVFTLTRTGGPTSTGLEVNVGLSGDAFNQQAAEVIFAAGSTTVEVRVRTNQLDTGDPDTTGTLTVQMGDGYTLGASSSAMVTVTLTEASTPATGRPAVSGMAQVGQTLTATRGNIADDNDGLPTAAAAYNWRWQREDPVGTWTDISTGTTYALDTADVGHRVRVVVNFTDTNGNTEEIDSEPTAAVTTAAVPNATGKPAVSGSAIVGETLTASLGTIEDPDGRPAAPSAYSWRWQRKAGQRGPWMDIMGADTNTYTLGNDDLSGSNRVRVVVSFTDNGGNPEEVFGDQSGWITSAVPVVSVRAAADSVVGDGTNMVVFIFEWSGSIPNGGPFIYDLTDPGDGVDSSREGIDREATAPATGGDMFELPTRALEVGDSDKVVTLTLFDGASYALSNPSFVTVSVTVTAPEPPEVTVAPKANGETVVGLNGNAEFVFTRTGGSTAELVVNFGISRNSVLDNPVMEVTFPDGDTEVDLPLPFAAEQTTIEEVTLTITNPADGRYTVGSGAGGAATVTVRGAAVPVVSIEPPSPATANEGSTLEFTVRLNTAATAAFTVDYSIDTGGSTPATADDVMGDGTGMVSFANGDTEKTFTITTVTDSVTGEGDETLSMTIGTVNPSTAAVIASDDSLKFADVTLRNVAPSLPEITVAAKTGGESVVGGEDAVFTLTRSGGDMTATLMVDITVSGAGALASEITAKTSATFSADLATTEVSVETNAIARGGMDQSVTLTVDDGAMYDLGSMASAMVTTTPPASVQNATGMPTFTGLGVVGETLTALIGTVDDPDGLPTGANAFSYRWQRRRPGSSSSGPWSDISGATDATYDLASADSGNRVRVVVSFTDNGGNQEERASEETTWVEAANQPEVTVRVEDASVVGNGMNDVVFILEWTGNIATNGPLQYDLLDPDDGIDNRMWEGVGRERGLPNTSPFRFESRTQVLQTGDDDRVVTFTIRPISGYVINGPSITVEARVTAPPAAGTPTPPDVTVAAAAASVVGGNDAVFTLTRSASSSTALPVTFAISGTHSVSSPPTSATILANMTAVDVTVPTTEITGTTQTVILTVTDAAAYDVGTPGMATVMVTAPTPPDVTVAAAAASVVGGNDAVFTLTRSASSATALPVTFAISGTHSVTSPPTSASIPANMTEVDVSIPTSAVTGADETVILTVTDAAAYDVGTPGMATVMVTAPPIPELTVAAQEPSVLGGDDAVFTLTRTVSLTAALTVDITVSGDGALASEITAKTEATFAVNSMTAEVSVRTNTIAEGDANQMVTLTVDAPGDNSYTLGSPASATVTVTSFDADAQSARVSEATEHSLALLAPNVAAGTVQVLTTRFDSMAAGAGASSTANLGGRPLGAFANSSASAAELTREVAGLFGLHLPAHGAADADSGFGASPTTGAPGAAYTTGAFEAHGTAAHTFGAHNADAQVGPRRDANDGGDWRAFEPGSLRSPDLRSPDLRSLIAQSGFSVQLGAAHGAHGGAGGGLTWTVWGRGAAGGFEGTEKDSALSVEGESVSAYLGADVQLGHLALGLALGRSEGELDYASTAGDSGGELETELTSVHPYLHWSGDEDTSLYAMLGYGLGEATLEDEEFGASLDSDLEMKMLAVGLHRALAGADAGLRYQVKLDAFWVDLESDGAAGQGNRNWAAVDSQSSRVRLALAGALPLLAGGGNAGELLAQGELAARLDGGDAQTGVGAEIGAGLTWRQGGVLLAVEGRVLLVHSEGEIEDYEEWGASLSASYQAGAMGRGLRFTLSPAWGDAQSGADALYQSAGALRDLGDTGRRQRSNDRLLPDRLDFELGYGLSALGGRAELLPFGRFSLAGDSDTRLRLGTRFDLPQRAGGALSVHNLGLELFGETQTGADREQRVGLELTLGF